MSQSRNTPPPFLLLVSYFLFKKVFQTQDINIFVFLVYLYTLKSVIFFSIWVFFHKRSYTPSDVTINYLFTIYQNFSYRGNIKKLSLKIPIKSKVK